QLEVVDDDQAEPALVLVVQPARLRTYLEQAYVARVVDEERRRVEPRRRLEHLPPLPLLLEAALAQVVALDAGLRGDEALRELGLGHLEGEERDRARVLLAQGDVLGDVGDQRALAHGGTRGDDVGVAR